MATNWKTFGQATKCATLLGGALLLVHTGPTQAQTVFGDAAIPTSPAAAPAQPGVELLELEFENIAVVDLLKVIAKTFNINVLINEDVSGTLHYVNIKGKSPQEALEFVARNAKLKLRREGDGTYQIGKNLDDETPAPIAASAPATGFGGLNNSAPGAALDPFGAPAITAQNSQRPATSLDSLNLPELVSPSTGKGRNSSRNNGPTPVRLRNVKPSIMAYWLDPANNPVPIEFLVANDAASKYGTQAPARLALNPADQAALSGGNTMGAFGGSAPSPYVNPYIQRNSSSRIAPEVRSNFQFGGFNNNRNQVGGGNQAGGAGGGGSFQLPGEIEEIIAIDAQNTLLVSGGTDEDIDRLREIIAILDRPLRQVEIEAQFVTVSTSDSRQFGIDFSSSRGNIDAATNGFEPGRGAGTFSVGFVRGNFRATLTALKAANRAKTITAPRVTAINNLTASIQSQESRPIILNSSQSGIGGQVGEQQNLIYINTSIGLNVTPTINGDDTITVLMQPQFQSQNPQETANGAPIITSQVVQTVANVRDGDTIALGGLRTKNITRGGSRVPLLSDIPIIGELFKSRLARDDEAELIIFVTARIVRRADDEFVPGT